MSDEATIPIEEVFYSLVLTYVWKNLPTFPPEASDEEIALVAIDRAIGYLDLREAPWNHEYLREVLTNEIGELRAYRALRLLEAQKETPPAGADGG